MVISYYSSKDEDEEDDEQDSVGTSLFISLSNIESKYCSGPVFLVWVVYVEVACSDGTALSFLRDGRLSYSYSLEVCGRFC